MQPRAFTLIELLIVIAIILILIAIALPNFLDAQIRAKVARVQGDLRSIATAQEAYFIDRRIYTDDCLNNKIGCIQLTTPIRYIAVLPIDPFGSHGTGSKEAVELLDKALQFYPMSTGTNPETYAKVPGLDRDDPDIRDVYLIYSGGPFDKEPGGPTRGFPREGSEYTFYSPTNGTKSFGGILRAGGRCCTARSLWNLDEAF